MIFKFKDTIVDRAPDHILKILVAHELAHGAFRLRHTFSDDALMAPKNTTSNLMDYKGFYL